VEQGPRLRGCDREAGQGARVGPSPVRVSSVRSPCKHGAPLPPCDAPRFSGDRRQSDCCQPPTRLRSHHHHALKRRPSWFARASHLDAADARDMSSWDHGEGFWLRPLRLAPAKPALACTETSLSLRFRWMLRPASQAPTAPASNGCCPCHPLPQGGRGAGGEGAARGRPLRWSASSSSASMRSSIASTRRSPMGVPSCG
jgi:hypothetical protein